MDVKPGHWNTAIVAGHPCHCYEPRVAAEHAPTILYLHSMAGEAVTDQPWLATLLDRHGLRAVSPQTGQSWWADRTSPDFDMARSAEDYVLHEALPLANEMAGSDSASGRVGLLGVGMGGQGALRLSYKYPDRLPVVAAIAPAIDFQILIDEGDRVLRAMYRDAETARQDTATLHIHPLNWPRHQWFCCSPSDYRWNESAERLRMKLYSLGVPHECDLETEAGATDQDYVEAMAAPAVEFVVARLEQERLRD
ncbi:alpha/beta hydrolase-fold protein [Pirellulales bacterium]|nr:alpha/beta hydrolase-fold protein [Pirellulales bacterium]